MSHRQAQRLAIFVVEFGVSAKVHGANQPGLVGSRGASGEGIGKTIQLHHGHSNPSTQLPPFRNRSRDFANDPLALNWLDPEVRCLGT